MTNSFETKIVWKFCVCTVDADRKLDSKISPLTTNYVVILFLFLLNHGIYIIGKGFLHEFHRLIWITIILRNCFFEGHTKFWSGGKTHFTTRIGSFHFNSQWILTHNIGLRAAICYPSMVCYQQNFWTSMIFDEDSELFRYIIFKHNNAIEYL